MIQMRALYMTNAREFLRDKMAVILIFALPVTLVVFFGLIFDSGALHVPGMLGVAILWLGLFGTAMPLMQQRTGKVLRRLSVTPCLTDKSHSQAYDGGIVSERRF